MRPARRDLAPDSSGISRPSAEGQTRTWQCIVVILAPRDMGVRFPRGVFLQATTCTTAPDFVLRLARAKKDCACLVMPRACHPSALISRSEMTTLRLAQLLDEHCPHRLGVGSFDRFHHLADQRADGG